MHLFENSISSKIYGFLYLTRPFNAVTVLLAFAVIFFISSDKTTIDFYLLLLSLIFAHSAFTVQNDYYDLEIDKSNSRDGLFVEGKIKPSEIKIFYRVLNFLALVLPLFTQQKLVATSVIFFLVILATLYNAKPFLLSRKPISSILLLAIYYATLPTFLGYQISTEKSSTMIYVLLIVIWSAQKFSISVLKDYKDIIGDKKYGKQTFLQQYGSNMVKRTSLFLGICSYIFAVIVLALSSEFNTLGLMILSIVAILCCKNRLDLRKNDDSEKLTRVFQKSFLFDNYFNLTVLLCLIRF